MVEGDAEGAPRCPICDGEFVDSTTPTARERGYIVDIECENGHVASLVMPFAVNKDGQEVLKA